MITFIAETLDDVAASGLAGMAEPARDTHVETENARIAARLTEAADLLESRPQANPFRVAAYRHAAGVVAALEQPVRALFERGGTEALEGLPGIGHGLSAAIAELLATGDWQQLRRLKGDADPVQALQGVPGIGPDLAREIHRTLHVDTLEALELACADGRLGAVPGIGTRRAAAICAALAAMLDRRRIAQRAPAPRRTTRHPPVAMLLDVDREYRAKASARRLPTIAPRRHNPGGVAWLPILHTQRDGWHFTALYSNTARAHELHANRDWVVIYHHDDAHAEGQHTVVTETRGGLSGHRVVRGREAECRSHYARRAPARA